MGKLILYGKQSWRQAAQCLPALPSTRPCPPRKKTHWWHCAPSYLGPFQSNCIWASSLHTNNNQCVSAQASCIDLSSRHVITSPFKCQPSYTHLFPLWKESFPFSNVCLSMYNVAKERIHFAQTAKADVGGRGRPPPLLLLPLHMWENANGLSESVRIKRSRSFISGSH